MDFDSRWFILKRRRRTRRQSIINPRPMIGRAWWDDLAVAIMMGSLTTILRKLSWRRWSTMSHWLVVRRRITGIGYRISHVGVVRMTIILRRHQGGVDLGDSLHSSLPMHPSEVHTDGGDPLADIP
jgi:phosphatidylglycerophosphate synthase